MVAIWLTPSVTIAAVVDSPKDQALQWIDAYRQVQVLFHEKDIERLRSEVAQGTDAQAAEWLEKTKEIRAALDSPEWAKTRAWLKEFLRVQAIYSDEQIAEFREKVKEAAKESPAKFMDIMNDVEQKRTALSARGANEAKIREQKMEVMKAYQQEAVAAREAERRQRAEAAKVAEANKPKPVAKPDYQRMPALVDSLDVARWTVMREFWGPYRR
jgi:hypothetical protein